MPKKKIAKKSQPPHIEFIARGVLLQGSKVLLCQNLKHGYLYLPGGHIEFSESAAQALQREFIEETGLKVQVGPLALATECTFKTNKKTHHEVNVVFHVQPPKTKDLRKLKSQEKDIAFHWLDLAAAPESDIRPLSAKAFLSALGHAPKGQIEWISEIQ
jgi:8-oxo-dGTP diphosphatase